jgi:hypothetical protein
MKINYAREPNEAHKNNLKEDIQGGMTQALYAHMNNKTILKRANVHCAHICVRDGKTTHDLGDYF